MSNTTTTWHSIREASMISGLPESTLRYYEQIGIIDPIARDPSSGHRVYSDKDIESLTTIACLAATGMPLESMREYLKNRFDGPEGARRQIELLDAQSLRLAAKAEALRIQQAYVSLEFSRKTKASSKTSRNSPARARSHAEHSDDDGRYPHATFPTIE